MRLPALRERREDIPLLAAHFLGRHAQRYRKALDGFDDPALRTLLSHSWPGNVRELDHAVERAVLMARGERVAAGDLGLQAARAEPSLDDLSLEEVERMLIVKTLQRHDGNVSRAALALGLSRSAMYRRLEKYAL